MLRRGVVVGEVNQWGRPRRLQSGVMTWTTRAHHRLGAVSCRRATRRRCRRGERRVEGADVVITQPVEHQGEQFAGGGHDADVAAAPGGDPVPVLPQAGLAGDALHGLDRRPAHQPRTLFRDPAAVHGGVGLVMFRGQPCGVPEVVPGSLTCGDRWLGMILGCRCGCCT